MNICQAARRQIWQICMFTSPYLLACLSLHLSRARPAEWLSWTRPVEWLPAARATPGLPAPRRVKGAGSSERRAAPRLAGCLASASSQAGEPLGGGGGAGPRRPGGPRRQAAPPRLPRRRGRELWEPRESAALGPGGARGCPGRRRGGAAAAARLERGEAPGVIGATGAIGATDAIGAPDMIGTRRSKATSLAWASGEIGHGATSPAKFMLTSPEPSAEESENEIPDSALPPTDNERCMHEPLLRRDHRRSHGAALIDCMDTAGSCFLNHVQVGTRTTSSAPMSTVSL